MLVTKDVKSSPSLMANPGLKRAHLISAIFILAVSGFLILVWTGALIGWAFSLCKILMSI
jgi:hypothetical protein